MKINKIHIVILLVVGLVICNIKNARAQQFQENEVRAAFLCNFAKFVYWPENSFNDDTSSVVIGILGEDPFGKAVDQIAKSATVNSRKIIIKRCKTVAETANCHILYIGKLPDVDVAKLLREELKTAVLTVSEQPGFCQMGGIINFSKQKMKYGFEINPTAAKKSDLTISAKLLNLAQIVE